MKLKDLLLEDSREAIKKYKGMPYEIWFTPRKSAYYAIGKGKTAGKIKLRHFDTHDQAEEHAELEIDGFLGESLTEGKFDVKEFHKSFSDAADEARRIAEVRGYEIDEDDWFREVTTGGRYTRARPSVGKSHRFSVSLYKNGKPQRKALHFSVYGMESGTYELTAYIN